MAGEVMALDAALQRAGENVVLRRAVLRSNVKVNSDVSCRAAVRTVMRSIGPDQMPGTISATDLDVTISPTQILNASWPGQDDSTPSGSAVNQALPRITDKVIVQGKERQVKVAQSIFVGGVWCRTDLVVAG